MEAAACRSAVGSGSTAAPAAAAAGGMHPERRTMPKTRRRSSPAARSPVPLVCRSTVPSGPEIDTRQRPRRRCACDSKPLSRTLATHQQSLKQTRRVRALKGQGNKLRPTSRAGRRALNAVARPCREAVAPGVAGEAEGALRDAATQGRKADGARQDAGGRHAAQARRRPQAERCRQRLSSKQS